MKITGPGQPPTPGAEGVANNAGVADNEGVAGAGPAGASPSGSAFAAKLAGTAGVEAAPPSGIAAAGAVPVQDLAADLQAGTLDAFEILHFIARKRLAAGKLTVVDATNVQSESRKPLVALNLYLTSTDEDLAKQIAREVRESSGGLPAVRAIGFFDTGPMVQRRLQQPMHDQVRIPPDR